MSELIERIHSRGYWDISIQPLPYEPERVPYEDLDEIVLKSAVRLRGWPVPYFDYRGPPTRADHWLGQDVDATLVSHVEAWRFFTSGQFTQLRGISADWRDEMEPLASPVFVPDGFQSVIEVWEILFYVTEVFELAGRLALTSAGGESATIDVELNGLTDRALIVGQQNRAEFFEPHSAGVPCLSRRVTASREDLIASSRELAVELSREFFVRFGWKPPLEQLAEHQKELIEGP